MLVWIRERWSAFTRWVSSWLFPVSAPALRDRGWRSVVVAEEPATLEPEHLYVWMEEGSPPWFGYLLCPCGCGARITLCLLAHSRPSWRVDVGDHGPSVHPSIYRKVGCKSHFWIRRGQLVWAQSSDDDHGDRARSTPPDCPG